MRHIGKAMISAVLLAGLALATQASAMPIAKIYEVSPGNNGASRTGFMLEHGDATRLDRLGGQTAQSVEAYYDFDAIGSTVGLTNGTTDLAVYPGGGFEAFAGPIGIRAEVGNDIYFNNGAHNNLRASLGPQLRF